MHNIKNIIQSFSGSFDSYEIVYRPRKHSYPEDIKSIYDSDVRELEPELRQDVNVLDMWAYESNVLDEEEYNAVFPGRYDFRALYGDANAKVLVIWLTRMSYEILTNPEIHTVRDFRLDSLGQYHEYYVVRPIHERSQRGDDLWDDEYENNSDDEDNMGLKYQVYKGAKEQLDRLYARESILISADALGVSYHLASADAWWHEETPLEHFGIKNAQILLIVLV